MAFDFPATPTIGQRYEANGVVFEWNGYAWDVLDLGGNALVPTEELPPLEPMDGQLWWKSSTGAFYIWYDDGSSAQWVMVYGGVGDVVQKTAETRNRLINPAMQLSLQNGTASTIPASQSFPADQWSANCAGPATPSTALVPAAGVVPNFIRLWSGSTPLASPAAGHIGYFMQVIEGLQMVDFLWGTANALPLVLRFKARCTVSQTISAAIRNIAGTRSYVKNFSVTTAFQEFVMPIPGCIDGAWPIDNTGSLLLSFTAMSGSTFITATPGQWIAAAMLAATGIGNMFAVANNGFDITDVGLYLDPENTGKAPPFEFPNIIDEQTRCQRYWQNLSIVELTYVDATQQIVMSLPTPMRTTPVLANIGGDGGFNTIGIGAFRQGGAATAFRGCTLTFNARPG